MVNMIESGPTRAMETLQENRILRPLREPSTAFGVSLCLMHLFLALFAYSIVPYSISQLFTDGLTLPTAVHWLGTDQIGRDYLSRLLVGGQVALSVSFVGVMAAMIVGTILGLMAGYFGGKVDSVVMRITDTLMSIPELILIAVLVLTFGKSMGALMFVITIVYLPGVIRVVRSKAVSITMLDYVRAAELRHESTWFILIREMMPNMLGLLAVELAIRTSSAILKISALSFLGLGISQPTPDWGLMVQEAMSVVFTDPWFLILPSIMLSSLIIGINFAVDGFARSFGISTNDL
jgi:peptide/nickel transport system permease protein